MIICDKRTLQGYRSHKRAQLYERNYDEACFLPDNIHSQTAMSFFSSKFRTNLVGGPIYFQESGLLGSRNKFGE